MADDGTYKVSPISGPRKDGIASFRSVDVLGSAVTISTPPAKLTEDFRRHACSAWSGSQRPRLRARRYRQRFNWTEGLISIMDNGRFSILVRFLATTRKHEASMQAA